VADLAKSLVVAFAAGFAVQQLLEIIDQLISATPSTFYDKWKKFILGIVALLFGLIISYSGDLRLLNTLGSTSVNVFTDHLVTGIFISAGTAGFNSIMKFLGYAKEEKKTAAANAQANAPGGGADGAAAAAIDRT
jgi:hypothetical protein